MQLPEKAIQEFQKIYKKYFDKDFSDQEAYDQIRATLVIVKLGLKPQQ